MLQPISAIRTNQQYYQTNKTTPMQPQASAQPFELSGVEVGRAIAVQRGVSFSDTVSRSAIKVIHDNSVNSFMETRYPYKAETLKDNYTALYTNLLIIFLTLPYHSEDTNIISSKDNKNNYHNLKFNPQKIDNIRSIKEGLIKQQQLIKILHDMDFKVVLDGIKEYEIELLEQDVYLSAQEKDERIKSISSISSEDIKQHIETFLLNKMPIIYCRDELKYEN